MQDNVAFIAEIIGFIKAGAVKYLLNWNMLSIYSLTAIFLVINCMQNGWKESLTGRLFKGMSATIIIVCLNLAFAPAVYLGVDWIRAGYAAAGIPKLDPQIWANIPFLLVALIGVVTHDFCDYVNHRIMHTKWFWPIHALHHSDHDVNGFTTFRVHFLEILFMRFSYVLLLTWLGMPAETQAAGALFVVVHNVYVHSKLDWTHGPFELLVASPRFHLWHHADVPQAHGKNLANVIPLFDYLGGTYYEGGRCEEKTGAKGVPHSDVVGLMTYPFLQWGRLFRDLFSKMAQR